LNEGMYSLVKGAYGFARRGIRPYYASVAITTRGLRVYNRKQLRDYCESAGGNILPYSATEHIIFEPPEFINSTDLPTQFNDAIGTHTLEQPYVATIPSGKVLSNGLALTEDGSIILEALNSRRDRFERAVTLRNVARLYYYQQHQHSNTKPTSYDLDLAFPLVGYHPNLSVEPTSEEIKPSKKTGSGHSGLILVTLPRLEGVKKYEREHNTTCKIILGPNPRPLLIESLELLGFDQEQLLQWHGEPLRVERMIIPSVRRVENDISYYRHATKANSTYKIMSCRGIKWVRETMTKNIDRNQTNSNFSNRIYISRADANSRRIINRDEVLEVLSKYEFNSYELSELRWKDQIRLFAGADFVVSPHGAGLANLAFSDNCSVVELFGKKRKPTFFFLASNLGFDYGMLACESNENNNLQVDVEELTAALDALS